MSIFSSTSISCRNWSPNYSVLVLSPSSPRLAVFVQEGLYHHGCQMSWVNETIILCLYKYIAKLFLTAISWIHSLQRILKYLIRIYFFVPVTLRTSFSFSREFVYFTTKWKYRRCFIKISLANPARTNLSEFCFSFKRLSQKRQTPIKLSTGDHGATVMNLTVHACLSERQRYQISWSYNVHRFDFY
jgi:hypothetical protein